MSSTGSTNCFKCRIGAGHPHYHLFAHASNCPLKPPKIITLCGSMRNFSQILNAAANLTDQGFIVLAPFRIVPLSNQDNERKTMLDELHRRKIDMADKVIVVTDLSGYFGESTRSEILYARRTGKHIDYWRMA